MLAFQTYRAGQRADIVLGSMEVAGGAESGRIAGGW